MQFTMRLRGNTREINQSESQCVDVGKLKEKSRKFWQKSDITRDGWMDGWIKETARQRGKLRQTKQEMSWEMRECNYRHTENSQFMRLWYLVQWGFSLKWVWGMGEVEDSGECHDYVISGTNLGKYFYSICVYSSSKLRVEKLQFELLQN